LELARNSVAILPDALLPACLLCATALLWKAAQDDKDRLLLVAVVPLLAGSYLRSEVICFVPSGCAYIIGRVLLREGSLTPVWPRLSSILGLVPLSLAQLRPRKRLSPTGSTGGFVLFAGIG